MTSAPLSSDFSYKKYSLEQLDNWVHDALNCEDLTPQDIYDTILKCVDDSVEYHKEHLNRSIELLSLLKGHRKVDFDYTATGEKFPSATQRDWNDFWEENYYPEEHQQYTEEEMNAMCDAAEDKEKCCEYNLREAEYYTKRAKLDAEAEAIKAAGGYEWTPDPQVSRNDPTRLKYENGWIYESPDGGKTVTKRRVGSLQKEIVKVDGYSTSERKHWTLPVEEVENGDTMETEYFITFPGDLLEAANLKEGDNIEWVDRGDGSYELRKVTQPLQMNEC
jgi:hypothetical protein